MVAKNKLLGLLGLSRSSYYLKLKKPNQDEQLKESILDTLRLNPAYGHRRIALALKINKKRVRRVMKKFGIKPYKRKARWRKRRDERRQPAIYINLIKGQFPIKPNLIWVSDFTYLKFQNKFLYLATFMDLYTREVVGWNISSKHDKNLVIGAFWDGFKGSGRLPKIVHSDQGSEYNCREYIHFIESLGIQISMSTKASPWENGYQESFYDGFKTDLGLEFDRFDSLGHFVEAIHQTINYYNYQRIHTALKMSPFNFKQRHS